MDQLRTVLNWLKAQHFWVALSGVVALIGLACWWMASGAMTAKYDTNQKTITQTFTSLDSVRNLPFHPNQTINEKQDAERKKQLESVTNLWQQLYDRQKSDVLKWPTALRQDFADAVEKKKFNDEIPVELCSRYRDYIDRHFPELPKKINARIIEDPTAGGAGGLGPGGGRFGGEEGGAGFTPGMIPEDADYICEWLDQNIVREELNFPERPSPLKIWVTQENLWVYHTLLNVIAKTNQAANATRMSNAAVKVVYSLEVGQRAAPYSRQPNRLLVPPPMVAAAGPGIEGGEGPAGPGPPGPAMVGPRMGGEGPGAGGIGGGGAMSPAQEQAFLMSYRYLDDKGLPVAVGGAAAAGDGMESAPPIEGAATADASAPAPPLDMAQFGVGYKRLPIRMALQMDFRWLPQLITNCANEPLRVEVQEVRINPPDLAGASAGGGSAGFGGYGGGTRGFGGGGEGGFGGGGGGASGANLFPDLTGIQNFPAQPHVGNVVIQGVIYIFNQPDMTLLETAAATSEAPVAPAP